MVKLHRYFPRSLLLAALLVGAACAPTNKVPTEESAAESTSTIDAAIARGDLAEVQRLLELDPQLAQQGEHPQLTPLHQALLRKQNEIALVLIAAGADLDRADGSQRTPLHLCVDRDLPEVGGDLRDAA